MLIWMMLDAYSCLKRCLLVQLGLMTRVYCWLAQQAPSTVDWQVPSPLSIKLFYDMVYLLRTALVRQQQFSTTEEEIQLDTIGGDLRVLRLRYPAWWSMVSPSS